MHDSAGGVGGRGGSARRQSTEAEEELDAFMRSHETVLTAADGVRELRRAGGELVEAFTADPEALVVELLAFCKAVVRACEGHGALRADELGLFSPVIRDAKATASRARVATRLALQARGRRERLMTGSPREDWPLRSPPDDGCRAASGPSGRCRRTGFDGTPFGDCSGPGLACGAEWSVQRCDASVDAASCSGASTHRADRGESTPAAATPASAATTSSAVTLYCAAVTPLSLGSVQADVSASRSTILRSPSSEGAVLTPRTPREFFSHFISCEDATPTILQRATKLPQRHGPSHGEQYRGPAPDTDTCSLSASILCHSPAADSDQQRTADAACAGADGQGAKTAARQVASLFLFIRDWLRYVYVGTRLLCVRVPVCT